MRTDKYLIIRKASVLDMNEIVKMAFVYHKEDPKFQDIASNPLKSFLYKMFGPLYVWLKFESFKAVVSDRTAGYIMLKYRKFSVHIWDLAVHSEFRGKGIGKSLMNFAEENAKSKRQYLTLAVLEDNTVALRLYQKLGYMNLQFSPISFRIKKIPTRLRSTNTIRLESISGEEALSYRNAHLLDVVEAVSGPDGREIVQRLYLSDKPKKRINRFKIVTSNKEAGYVSVEQRKDLTSIFFILHPDFWSTNTEMEVVNGIIEYASRLFGRQVEIQVMQAYEKSLRSSFKKTGVTFDRVVPRLGLVKKL